MPPSNRRRVLKIPLPWKGKSVARIKSGVPSFGDTLKTEQSPSLPAQVLDSKSRRTRIMGGVSKSKIQFSSGNFPLKPRNVVASKMSTCAASLTNKKVRSRVVTSDLMQEKQEASRFLSLLRGKGRMIKRKAVLTRLSGRKTGSNVGESHLLSYDQRLRLFQALLKEPLPFLELHGSFGISKQTIKGFVRNGFLKEMWGPKAVGVRFKLTSKGKIYLKELEAAAKYEPKMREKSLIRLKHRIPM